MFNDKCPDGATDEQHDTMLDQTGQCPWCGQEEAPELMNPETSAIIHEMLTNDDHLSIQQAVAISACIHFMLDHTVSAVDPLRAEFQREYGTYGLEGLDSLR